MLKKTLLATAVASLACNAYAAKSENAKEKKESPLGKAGTQKSL